MKQPSVDGLLKQETALDAYLHTDSAMMIMSHYCIIMDLKRILLPKISWIQNLIILSTYSNQDVNLIDVIKQNLG